MPVRGLPAGGPHPWDKTRLHPRSRVLSFMHRLPSGRSFFQLRPTRCRGPSANRPEPDRAAPPIRPVAPDRAAFRMKGPPRLERTDLPAPAASPLQSRSAPRSRHSAQSSASAKFHRHVLRQAPPREARPRFGAQDCRSRAGEIKGASPVFIICSEGIAQAAGSYQSVNNPG